MRIKGLILGFVPKHLAQRGTHCPFYATAQEESGGEERACGKEMLIHRQQGCLASMLRNVHEP